MNFKALARVILYTEMAEQEFYYTGREMQDLERTFAAGCEGFISFFGLTGPELADEILKLKSGEVSPDSQEVSPEAMFLFGILIGWATCHRTPMCDALGFLNEASEYEALADLWRLSL